MDTEDTSSQEPGEQEAPAEPFTPPSTRRTLRQLGNELFRPPATTGRPPSAAETRRGINRIERREISIGIALVLIDVYLLVAYTKQYIPHSGTADEKASANAYLGVGLLLVGIIAAGLSVRRRALAGFAAFLAAIGFSWVFHGNPVVVVINFAFGAWLVLKASRVQRENRQSLDAERALGRSKRATQQGATADHSRPVASKRYTPPKKKPASGRR